MHKLNVHLKKGALCGVLALALGSLVVGNVAAIVAPTPAYAASKKSSKKSKKTKDGSVKGVKVKKKVDKYTWSELSKISDAMTKSGSRKAALKIAKKYKLCDKKGKLDGSQTKKVALNDCESSAMIVGFYHDDLSDGSGKAGITWQFTDCLYMGNPLYASHVTDFNILPSTLKDCLATVKKNTVYRDDAKASQATSEDVQLWAPSATEILGDASEMKNINRDSEWMTKSLNAEGTQYDYYEAAGMNWTIDSKDCEFTLSDSGYWIELVKTDDGLSDQKALEQGKVKLDSSYKKINGFDWKAGFRSIYYDPLTPDAGLDHLAGYSDGTGNSHSFVYAEADSPASNNNASWPTGLYGYSTNEASAVMPMFCLTSPSDDSADSGSNGVAVQDNVNDYSWKDLKSIANEIAAAQDDSGATEIAKKYHLVGDDGNLSSASYKSIDDDINAYIVGFNHDDRSDGKGKAGITFLIADASPAKLAMNKDGSNTGGWKDSDLRRSIRGEVYKCLPQALKSNIVRVKKLSNNSGVTTDPSSVTSTDETVWLPSMVELIGKDGLEEELGSGEPDQLAVYEAEGTQYAALQGDNDTRWTGYDGFTGNNAWTRTCDASQSGCFLIYRGNDFGGPWDTNDELNIYPGFCL